MARNDSRLPTLARDVDLKDKFPNHGINWEVRVGQGEPAVLSAAACYALQTPQTPQRHPRASLLL